MCKLKTSIALRNTSFEVIDRMKRARNDRDPSHTFATNRKKKNKKRKRKTESINEKKKIVSIWECVSTYVPREITGLSFRCFLKSIHSV